MNGLFDGRVVALISLSSIALPSAERQHHPSFKKDSKSRVVLHIAIGIKLKQGFPVTRYQVGVSWWARCIRDTINPGDVSKVV